MSTRDTMKELQEACAQLEAGQGSPDLILIGEVIAFEYELIKEQLVDSPTEQLAGSAQTCRKFLKMLEKKVPVDNTDELSY